MSSDAKRYAWLRDRLLAIDFKYNAGNDTEDAVLIFELPDGVSVSANLDATIDAAMALEPPSASPPARASEPSSPPPPPSDLGQPAPLNQIAAQESSPSPFLVEALRQLGRSP